MTGEGVLAPWALPSLLALVVPLLAVHAVRTHGGFYAGIWIGLTGAIGFAHEVLLARDGAIYAGGSASIPPYRLFFWWAAVIYLGALLAKGFVERSRWRGAVLPFVLANGLFSALVALPIAIVATPAGWWWRSAHGEPALLLDTPIDGILSYFVGGALFGFAYRMASRVTEDDRKKILLLALVGAPIVVAAHYGLMRAASGWLART